MQGELVIAGLGMLMALVLALAGMLVNWLMFVKLRNERRDYLKETMAYSTNPAANHLAHEMEKTDRAHDLATAGAETAPQLPRRMA